MKKFTRYSKVIGLGMALSLMPMMMTGCTDDEIAQAVGAGAIIAGAVVIGATTHCEGGYRNVCHDYRDYWGNVVSECRQEYDSCAVLVPNDRAGLDAMAVDGAAPAAANAANKPASPDAAVTDVAWGSTFDIGFDASQKVIDALKAARDHSVAQPLFDLGLNSDDLKDIAQNKLPSAAGIDAVARKLNQQPAMVQAMFQRLIAAHH